MSEFHYVRTLGVDGGVDAVEGPAVGLDIGSLLKDGLPPFKVTLEIIAAICEILDIADQDGEVHGDVGPRYVFMDETGAVSLEGFGARRNRSTAPEGSPKGTATDLYGLGLVTFALFAGREMPALPNEADPHDDSVIDSIIEVNFDNLPEEIVGDIQWFIAKLLAFDREERPTAVDSWRTFIAFADAVPGPRLDDWAAAAMNGGGERRSAGERRAAPPEAPAAKRAAEPEEEDLGGPVMAQGPLAKGGLNFDTGGKKGAATAFWSRDQMKAALEAEDQEEEYKPAVGGGSATAFWSREQMQAMSEGRSDAPRPKRKAGGRAATSFMERPQPGAASPPPAPSRPQAPPPGPRGGAPAGSAPRGGFGAAPPMSAGPQGGGAQPQAGYGGGAPPQQGYGGGAPMAAPGSPAMAYEEPPAAGGGGAKIAIIVAIVAIIVCSGTVLVLGGGGAVVALVSGGSTGTAVVETPPKDAPPVDKGGTTEAPRDTGAKDDEKEEPKPETKSGTKSGSSTKSGTKSGSSTKSGTTSGSSTKSGTSGSSTKSGTTGSSTKSGTTGTTTSGTTGSSTSGGSVRPKDGTTTTTTTTTTTAPVEAPPPVTGPQKVTLKTSGRGKLRCSDGQTPAFDGSAALEFDGSAMPVTCMVIMADGATGAFQVERAASVTCNATGTDVLCL